MNCASENLCATRDKMEQAGPRDWLLWLLRRRWRFRVSGESMSPLLRAGDEVLVNPRAYRHDPPHPGDIVVAHHPYQSSIRLIKRVTKLLNGDRCVLEGDNPFHSTDTRSFGPVRLDQIIGRVTSRLP